MLYLVHHADALEGAVDARRPLSEGGRLHAERLAERAAARGVKPAVILHSGKVRARQTAEYFLRACNPLAEFAAARGLQPGDPPEWIRDVLAVDEREIMLVGHMPHLTRLHRLLLEHGGSAASHDIPQHGMVAMQRRAGGWDELWRDAK